MYIQYPIMTKRKQIFRNYCKCIENKKQKVFRPFATRLRIELRYILFPLIIVEMFLQLGVQL